MMLTTVLSVGTVKASPCAVRISGGDRYATASQVSQKNWINSQNVILVSGEGYADAVSASVLSKKLDAPILLTRSDKLNSYTANEIDRLKPKNVYIIGGSVSISQNIRDILSERYNVISLGGSNRYETNVKVADELVKLGVNADNVLVVGGNGFSDALSVAPIAAAKDEIVLLANNNENLIKPAADFIKVNNSKATIIGTENVIKSSIYNDFKAVKRIDGGENRFDTNLKILDEFNYALKNDKIYIANASGNGYADALVASAVAGKTGSPLVLLDSQSSLETKAALSYITGNRTETSELNVIGGTSVITNATFDIMNRKITVNDAVSILKSTRNALIRNDSRYIYSQDDNYILLPDFPNSKEILNDYYIFSVVDGEGDNVVTSDFNLCVNKYTGEVYVATPSNIFVPIEDFQKTIQELYSK